MLKLRFSIHRILVVSVSALCWGNQCRIHLTVSDDFEIMNCVSLNNFASLLNVNKLNIF